MRAMARNPLEDVARGLRVLGERLTQGGDPGDWIAEQLRRPEPVRTLPELQAELDSLIGLETVKEQVHALVADRERIGLVDEEHTVERATDHAVGLDRRHADVLADEPGPVDLDEVAAPQQSHGLVHLGEQPRDRRLARAGIAEEDEVLRGRDLR